MTGDTPDWRPSLRGRVRAHRLAQAAQAHPAPVRLETGHFAPPNVHAVWLLPVRVPAFGQQVVQIVWHEDGDVFGMRIMPPGTEGGQ